MFKRQPDRLDRTLAVVTGGASGIGAALAREVAGRGARVAVLDVDVEGAAKVAAELPGEAAAYALDVRHDDAVGEVARRVMNDMGTPRMVFANAGVAALGPLLEMPLDDVHWMLDINLRGAIYTARHFTPAMVNAGQGALVFTASIAGLVGAPGMPAYSASKFAVVGMAESLAVELAGTGVTVTTLCPGYVPTGLHDATRYSKESFRSMMNAKESKPGGVPADVVARQTVDDALAGRALVVTGIERFGVLVKRLSPELYRLAASRLGRFMGMT